MKKLYTLMFALLIPIKGLCAEGPNKEDPNKKKLGNLSYKMPKIIISEQTLQGLKQEDDRRKNSGSAGPDKSKSVKPTAVKKAARTKKSGSAWSEVLQRNESFITGSDSRGAESRIYNKEGVGDLPTFKYDGGLSVSENLRNIKYMLFALKPGERLAIEGLNTDNHSRQEEFVDLVKKVPGIVLIFRFSAMGVAVFKKK